jgi:hypothetical protein
MKTAIHQFINNYLAQFYCFLIDLNSTNLYFKDELIHNIIMLVMCYIAWYFLMISFDYYKVNRDTLLSSFEQKGN